jgi:hypothetical protein
MRPILAGITLVGPPTVASLSKKETYNQEKETYGLVSYGLMMILFTGSLFETMLLCYGHQKRPNNQ